MQKTKAISFVLILVLLSTMFLAVMLTFDWGNAQAETSQSNMTSEQLFSVTNTYDCEVAEDVYKDGKEVFNIKYDMSSKNDNLVMNSPQITVLTHGLGGSAADWSNQYDGSSMQFEYDENSIIEKLKVKLNSHCILQVKMVSHTNYELYANYGNQKEKIENILDISKHVIVVFEAYQKLASNDSVYYEFNHAISNIVLQVKKLNGGILPKLNLIGHSRGGLTNMQYALDHPDMIESLISIGTPYFSSNMANMFGEKFMGKNDGLDDIVNQDVYMQYYNRWNDNYDILYKDINAVAIGGYSSLTMLPLILTKDKSGEIGLSESESIAAATFLEGVVIPYITGLKAININMSVIISLLTRGLNAILPNSKIVDALTLIFSEIGFTYKFPFTAYFGDILVPLDSQLGIENGIEVVNIHEYKGFKRYKRYFTEYNSDFDRVAEAMPPAVHNLEPRDEKIIQWVCNECNIKEGFGIEKLSSTTATVTGYYGRADIGTVVVPSQIDGFDVVKIDDNAFNESLFKENMTKVILPQSVVSIGENAFADCVALKSVEFDGGSMLESIGTSAFAGCVNLETLPDLGVVRHISDGAFAGTKIQELDFTRYPLVSSIGLGAFRECENLQSVNLGNNVTSIGEYAFFGCNGITNITIPQGVVEIGAGAFANCMAMNNIDVDSSSNIFKSIDGVLFSKDGSVICQYPIGKVADKFTVPDNVMVIDDCAFYGSNLCEIKLNKDLQRIGKHAFQSNANLTEIVVYKEVADIDIYAFADCVTLKKITLFNPNPNQLSDWAFEFINEEAVFYLTSYTISKEYDGEDLNKGDYFVDRFALANYQDNLRPIEYYIHYYDGDKLLETRTQFYLAEHKNYAKKEGYDFYCWHYKGTDELYNSADCIEQEEISLQAVWGVKEFVVKFSKDNNSGATEYGYLSIVNGVGDIVMQPTKVQYGAKATEKLKETLMNWYYNEGKYYEGMVLERFDFSTGNTSKGDLALSGSETQEGERNLVGDYKPSEKEYDFSAVYAFVETLIDEGMIDFNTLEDICVRPIFRIKKVSYNLDPKGAELSDENSVTKTFGDSYVPEIPEKWGYNFLGWKVDSITANSNVYDVSKLPKFTSSNNSYIGKIYSFTSVPDLIYKVPFDYTVKLVAQWKYEAIDMYTMKGEDISGGNTKWLDFSRYPSETSVLKTFKVAATISKLYIKDMILLEEVSFKILGDCTVILENCFYIGERGSSGIDAWGHKLNLITYNNNAIVGGYRAFITHLNDPEYCAGISASSLTIEAFTQSHQFLSIQGGEGHKLSDSCDIGLGGAGLCVEEVEFVRGTINIVGGTGGTGKSGTNGDSTSTGVGYAGGDGGKGGIGGYGLYFTKEVRRGKDVTRVTIQGGTGGTGGKGGYGGKGADGKFLNPADKGGNGGKGGGGGTGGTAAYNPLEVFEYSYFHGISLYGGQGGQGGAGGQGGEGGQKYLSSNHAAQGASGKKGNVGEDGVDYYDLEYYE